MADVSIAGVNFSNCRIVLISNLVCKNMCLAVIRVLTILHYIYIYIGYGACGSVGMGRSYPGASTTYYMDFPSPGKKGQEGGQRNTISLLNIGPCEVGN